MDGAIDVMASTAWIVYICLSSSSSPLCVNVVASPLVDLRWHHLGHLSQYRLLSLIRGSALGHVPGYEMSPCIDYKLAQ